MDQRVRFGIYGHCQKAASMTEGVIKFHLDYQEQAPLSLADVAEINAWRRVLWLLGLIGRDPRRYDGLGYGNISRRVEPWQATPEQRAFIISGSQTGGLPELGPEHYATVFECQPRLNRVRAAGPIRPSAESLTHGTVYAADDTVRYVMHVHSPEIWGLTRRLGLALTDEQAAYGTPEMAEEIMRLRRNSAIWERRLFVMGGHEDGLVAFGSTPLEAATVLVDHFARALQVLQSRG